MRRIAVGLLICLSAAGCGGGNAESSNSTEAASPSSTPDPYPGGTAACGRIDSAQSRMNVLAEAGLKSDGDNSSLLLRMGQEFSDAADSAAIVPGSAAARVAELARTMSKDLNYAAVDVLGQSGGVVSPDQARASLQLVIADYRALSTFCADVRK